jgi:tetratricopeptide (TPR) repeat protein
LLGHPDDPSEVARILAIADRGLSLAPDDPSALSYYGTTLCYLGSPREALRFTADAVARIPGDGIAQNHHGIVCAFLGDTGIALTHLDLAKRLMPGMFLLWAPRWFQALALIGAQRWSEASEAMEACVGQNPQQPHCRAQRAILASREGRREAALADIHVAQKSGLGVDQFELSLRRLLYANRRVADELAHELQSLWVQSEFDR